MDEIVSTLIFMSLFFFVFLASPFMVIICIQTITIYKKTCKWEKSKFEQSQPESANLVSTNTSESDHDFELDPEDSADEAEIYEREETRQDLQLTFGQKFRKDLRRAFVADKEHNKRQQKLREREERRTLTKKVARELHKMKKYERGEGEAKQRKNIEDVEASLPSYTTATKHRF